MSVYVPDKNFLFFHIYKCAGQSVTDFIHDSTESICIGGKPNMAEKILVRSGVYQLSKPFINDSVSSRFAYENKVAYEHPSMEVIKNIFSYKIYEMNIMTIIRNPYDWHVSLYEYARTNKKHKQNSMLSNMSFLEYCRWRSVTSFKSFRSRLNFDDDKMLRIKIIKLEEMDWVLPEYLKSNGFKCNVNLKKSNKSIRRSDYRSYYCSQARRIIEEVHGQDIMEFNYEF